MSMSCIEKILYWLLCILYQADTNMKMSAMIDVKLVIDSTMSFFHLSLDEQKIILAEQGLFWLGTNHYYTSRMNDKKCFDELFKD